VPIIIEDDLRVFIYHRHGKYDGVQNCLKPMAVNSYLVVKVSTRTALPGLH